jgi:hypothetical protein
VRTARFLVPSEPRERLRAAFRNNAVDALASMREVIEVTRVLSRDGIVCVPYKGVVLSAHLYGHPALRQSCDIDLVIHRSDLQAVRHRLLERGYQEARPVPPAQRDLVLTNRYSLAFVGPGALLIEVHWAFTNRDVAFPLGLEQFAGRLVGVDLGGHEVRSFAPQDLLLLLCVHGAKHRWDRLEWVAGIAELLRRLSDSEIEETSERARFLECGRTLLLGLELARRYGDRTLPMAVAQRIERDPAVPKLADDAGQLLANEHYTPESASASKSLSHDLFHYRLREGLRERVRFLLYRWTTPSRPEEWRTITVWGRVVALHRLTRPFQVIGRMFPALYWLVRERTRRGRRIEPRI